MGFGIKAQVDNFFINITDWDKMNKSELIDAIAEAAGFTKSDATKALDAVNDSIIAALQSGDQVSLVGFGTYSLKERAARIGRNPRTGEAIQIKAAKIPSFKPGKALKEAISN